eukprot:2499224-Rhodomonas_salina.1
MAPSYKDHPIPELKGEPTGNDTTFLRPTKAVYEKWMTSASLRKVLGALGIYWIIPMALALEFERGRYHELIDGMPDDNDDPIFQYIVVATAIQHGALQSLPGPETTDALVNKMFCKVNYNFIIRSIAGFSAQLSLKCYVAFPNIFAHQDALAVQHPLAGLREMADIHSNYQRDGAAINASSAWKENFAALGRSFMPETTAI